MSADFDILTFDCYGTLIDWEGGITTAFSSLGKQIGQEISPERVLQLHARIEPEVQAESFQRYREVLDLTAARIAGELGLEIPGDLSHFLSESLSRWQPFPDTGPALESLRGAGYRLGILSNVDDDLLAGTLEHLPVNFELLVTAEQVGSYKPALGHFREAGRQIGDSSWLHVAQSFFHDVQPAVALHLPAVWINRKNESPLSAARPQAEFPDMASFAKHRVERSASVGS